MKLRMMSDQGRKFKVLTHPAVLACLKAKVMFLTSDLEVKELDPQTFPGLVKEAAPLRDEVKKVHIGAFYLNALL